MYISNIDSGDWVDWAALRCKTGLTMRVHKKDLDWRSRARLSNRSFQSPPPLTVTPNILLVNTVPRELQVLSCHFQLDASYPHVELR